MMSLLIEQKPIRTGIVWLHHIHRSYGVLFLLLGTVALYQTNRPSLISILHTEHNVPELVVPGLFFIFGVGLIIIPSLVRIKQLFFWTIPLQVYIAGLFWVNASGITITIYLHGLVSLFFIMALIEIIERITDANRGNS